MKKGLESCFFCPAGEVPGRLYSNLSIHKEGRWRKLSPRPVVTERGAVVFSHSFLTMDVVV